MFWLMCWYTSQPTFMAQIFILIFILTWPVVQCLQIQWWNHPTLLIFLSRTNVGLCRVRRADGEANCLEHLEICPFHPVAQTGAKHLKKSASKFWLITHFQDHNVYRFRTKCPDKLMKNKQEKKIVKSPNLLFLPFWSLGMDSYNKANRHGLCGCASKLLAVNT